VQSVGEKWCHSGGVNILGAFPLPNKIVERLARAFNKIYSVCIGWLPPPSSREEFLTVERAVRFLQ
jgi:hypothetical protein